MGWPAGIGAPAHARDAARRRARIRRGLYARGENRWELGRPSPSLHAHLDLWAPPAGRVAVLGCGRGHDRRLWARHGYRVWGFDFTPEPLAAARELTRWEGLEITFGERDIFTLADDDAGFFDGLWEYTCFCAIDPARRPEYAALITRLLRPAASFSPASSRWCPSRRPSRAVRRSR